MPQTPLETQPVGQPASPLFARVASETLGRGNPDQALEICLQGMQLFPEYATGRIVLARCYLALGRPTDAVLEYRRALMLVPDNEAVRAMAANAERREEEAFAAFAEERGRTLGLPKGRRSFDEYLSGAAPNPESTVDFLLKQLQHASRVVPGQAQRAPGDQPPGTPHRQAAAPGGAAEGPSPVAGGAGRIVTPTLAEIYADQGEYSEAIKAYKRLLEQRPGEAERYGKRLSELEELARLQKLERDQKSPDT